LAGVALRASEPVAAGQLLELDVPEPRPLDLAPEPMELSVVYEDGIS